MNASFSSLMPERLRSFSKDHTYQTVSRPIPREMPENMTAATLEYEYRETLSFESKQLKKDPRLKPDDIEVVLDHMKECTSCRQRQAAEAAVHADWCNRTSRSCPGHPRAGWQLLVDDFSIYSWRNTLRFLNPPEKQQQSLAVRPQHNWTAKATRFGCPCSVVRERTRYRAYHAGLNIAGKSSRYSEWPMAYSISTSVDGLQNWKFRGKVAMNGYTRGLTGSMTVSRAWWNGTEAFIAGYEGSNSRVCLAHSPNGRHWHTVPTSQPPTAIESVATSGTPPLSTISKTIPPHLRKALRVTGQPLDLRKREFRRPCIREVRYCFKRGQKGGDDLLVKCIWRQYFSNRTSVGCHNVLAPIEWSATISRANWEANFSVYDPERHCIDGSYSMLGRAGDCNIQPFYARGRQLVMYRRDFGTPGGWREIRGVQVVELNDTLADQWQRPPAVVAPIKRVSSYYLDRLGKLERFRRQVYSLTFTQMSDDLWFGLMTVIEWPKDLGELTNDRLPAFQRDTASIYLVTSRDGIHVDDDWVYARRPLVSKGKTQGAWDSGMQPSIAYTPHLSLSHLKLSPNDLTQP